MFVARRDLLKAGLALGFYTGLASASGKKTNEPSKAPDKPAPSSGMPESSAPGLSPNAFVHIAPDGVVTIACQRSEMGQGIRSSLPILIADELGADVTRLRVVQADGDERYGDQNTDGSSSVRTIYEDMRRIGATPRMMLVAAAAKRWNASPDELTTRDGFVFHGQKLLSFGDLAEEAAKEPIPSGNAVKLRPEAELRHVGTELPLYDARAFVTGAARYGADVRLHGMLVAVIARPPVVGGRALKYDDAAAKKIPGVKHVLAMPVPKAPWRFQVWGGVAVLAENTWAAMRGCEALKITWDDGPNGGFDSGAELKTLSESVSRAGQPHRKLGDAERALKSAAKVVDAEYHVPHLAHVPMEPPVALANVTREGCEVWTSTQNPQDARDEAAGVTGLPKEKVTVHVTFLGGGFGRKSKADFVAEAAWLSQQIHAPVRVQWTREDDVRHDYYNTVNTQRLTAGLDEHGKVVAWRHRTAYPPIGTTFGAEPRPGAGDLQQGVLDLALEVPNILGEACAADPHVRVGWLRSVYNIFHAYGIGSFVDELAQAKGVDARAMWLELLGPPKAFGEKDLGVTGLKNYGADLGKHPVDAGRLRNVIERVTASASWPDRKGRALGLAAHRSFLSYTAIVASVVKGPLGEPRVDEVWVSFDAGKVINLDRVKAQVEGSVAFGLSLALFGEISLKSGATVQSNFHDYRIARIGDVPRRIHIDVVKSDAPPAGVGEPGVPPVAPAIANGWFALTGERVRRLPLGRSA